MDASDADGDDDAKCVDDTDTLWEGDVLAETLKDVDSDGEPLKLWHADDENNPVSVAPMLRDIMTLVVVDTLWL